MFGGFSCYRATWSNICCPTSQLVFHMQVGPSIHKGSLMFHTLVTNEANRPVTTGKGFVNLYKDYSFSFKSGFYPDWIFASMMVVNKCLDFPNMSGEILINYYLPGDMVALEKHPVIYFSCGKTFCQDGHPPVKHCFKPKRIYVNSNGFERSN